MIPISPANPAHHQAIARIWNDACNAMTGSHTLDITPRLAQFNLGRASGATQAGRFAVDGDGNEVGYVIASAQGKSGWIDSIAVEPATQRAGAGAALLAWAEDWLLGQGCTFARLGGSLRPFLPGYPRELGRPDWFTHRRFEVGKPDWDVAADLAILRPYHGSAGEAPAGVEARMAQPGEEAALREFFVRAFPGRWLYEYDEHLREGGKISDYAVLITPDSGAPRIEAFCMTTMADSLRPLDRFYMNTLPRPWVQAGPLGTSETLRGKGYAALVVNTALASLRARGGRGCIIDWTSLTDFYAKFGFRKFREYVGMTKRLG